MRITKELYNKLSKTKQTELKERIDKARDNALPPLMFFATYLRWTVIFAGFTLIVMPLWKMAWGGEIFLSMTRGLFSILNILGIIIGIGLCIDLALALLHLYKINKIKSEYFDVEVKVKK
jgi:hypothetical protein